jgi:hypothetical protein
MVSLAWAEYQCIADGWQVESWLIVESAQALAAYCILLADAAVRCAETIESSTDIVIANSWADSSILYDA